MAPLAGEHCSGHARWPVAAPAGQQPDTARNDPRETKTRDENARRRVSRRFRVRASSSCSEAAPAVHPEGGDMDPRHLVWRVNGF